MDFLGQSGKFQGEDHSGVRKRQCKGPEAAMRFACLWDRGDAELLECERVRGSEGRRGGQGPGGARFADQARSLDFNPSTTQSQGRVFSRGCGSCYPRLAPLSRGVQPFDSSLYLTPLSVTQAASSREQGQGLGGPPAPCISPQGLDSVLWVQKAWQPNGRGSIPFVVTGKAPGSLKARHVA